MIDIVLPSVLLVIFPLVSAVIAIVLLSAFAFMAYKSGMLLISIASIVVIIFILLSILIVPDSPFQIINITLDGGI